MTERPDMVYEIRQGVCGTLARVPEAQEAKEIEAALKEHPAPRAGTTIFVASTAEPDRVGDVIEQDWRLAAYRRNPVVLAEHDSRVVVGRADYAGVPKEIGSLVIRVMWDDDAEINPVGALLAHQHREGFRRAGSVGFLPGSRVERDKLPTDHEHFRARPKDAWSAGAVYRHNELLEFSSVAVPANPNALQQSASASALRAALDQVLPRAIRDAILTAVRRDQEVRRAILAVALAEPVPDSTLSHLWPVPDDEPPWRTP